MFAGHLDCSKITKLIEPYVDGELGPVMRDAVGSHLLDCPCCAAQAHDLVQLNQAVAAWPVLGPLEAKALAGVREELRMHLAPAALSPKTGSGWRRWLRTMSGGPRPGPLLVLRQVRHRLAQDERTTAAPLPRTPPPKPSARTFARRAVRTWGRVQTIAGGTARLSRRVVDSLGRIRWEAISLG